MHPSRFIKNFKICYHFCLPHSSVLHQHDHVKLFVILVLWTFCYTSNFSIVYIEPAKNAVKYLTWHRSASSHSSSFRNLLVPTLKDNVDGSSSNLFNNFCMNSGSHASTLERLYAWERKLYDEIKVTEIFNDVYNV